MIHFFIIDLSVFHLGNSDHLDNSDHGPKNQISTICIINNKLATFFPFPIFHGLEGCRRFVFQIFQVIWLYLIFVVSLSPQSITEGMTDHQNCSVIPDLCPWQTVQFMIGPESKFLFQCPLKVHHRYHNFYLFLLARPSAFYIATTYLLFHLFFLSS